MAETMTYLHENAYIIHRDLHLDQWYIQPDSSLLLTDFSLSLILGPSTSVAANAPKEFTPICCSPEQTLSLPYAFDADVWMLGCWWSTAASAERVNCFQDHSDERSLGGVNVIDAALEQNCIDYQQKISNKE